MVMSRTDSNLTEHSARSRGSNSSSDSGRSWRRLGRVFSRSSSKSGRKVAIARERSNTPKSDCEIRAGKDASGLLEDETDVWERDTVLLLGGRQSSITAQLLVLKALMSEIRSIEKDKHAKSSFDSPLILCGRLQPRESQDECYLPCHYFDSAGGTRLGGLLGILLGRLRMTVDEAIDEYEALNPYRQTSILPLKRKASQNEKGFRSCLDPAVKRPLIRLPGTMVKEAPISTKFASGPYMCRTFLRNDASSKIDLSSCNSDEKCEEDVIDAAYKTFNQRKKGLILPIGGKSPSVGNSPKSDFLMSISRMPAGGKGTDQRTETEVLERFSTNDMPRFMKQGAGLSCRDDILSSLETHEETDQNAARWLKQIRSCAKYLVEKRQRRAQTTNWERFALGTNYKCGYCAAKDREKTYDQYLLIEHLQKEHRAPPSDDDRFDTYCEILRHFRTVAVT